MPIAIGQKVESDFRNPLGLLSDCHRRIERFLNALIVISEQGSGNQLDKEQRQQFEVALRYFREAAPKRQSELARRTSTPESVGTTLLDTPTIIIMNDHP